MIARTLLRSLALLTALALLALCAACGPSVAPSNAPRNAPSSSSNTAPDHETSAAPASSPVTRSTTSSAPPHADPSWSVAPAAKVALPTLAPRPPCVPRTEVLPTSTAYGPGDVTNDIAFPLGGLGYLLRESTVVVSATLGAVTDRTAYRMRRDQPFLQDATPIAVPTHPLSHLLFQPITVQEVFRAPEGIERGSVLMLRYADPDELIGIYTSFTGESLDRGEPGERYVFFLEEAETFPPSQYVEEFEDVEPQPPGPAYQVVNGPYGRLIVNADRVRYSDRDRHRTEFTLDKRGCEFLEMLEEELAKATPIP